MAGRVLCLATAVAAVVLLVAGCGDDEPARRVNRPPTAELTSGPVEGETTFYRIRIFWTGSDPDGFISHYEYAVDPPPVFTEAEIADPTDSAGLQTRLLPGPGEHQDTLRVSKVAGGETYTFDWVSTLAFNRQFLFSATEKDSLDDMFGRIPPGRFIGMHAIYVRSVDDRGAASEPAHVAFTAETVAPTSVITVPAVTYYPLVFGPRITVTWSGYDPDKAGGAGPPAGFLYRLLDLQSLDPPVSILAAEPSLLMNEDGSDSGWTYQSADTLGHTFFPDAPGSYLFGVRAVDEAGAVEPYLQYERNVMRFQTLAEAGSPIVQLFEPTLGTFSFRGALPLPYDAEVPLGTTLHFQVSCSAEDYGGACEAMRWGLDVADLESDEDWSDWVPIGPLPPITMPERAGFQSLYVQVVDDQDAVSTGVILLDLVDFPLDREVLFVDDTRDQTYPRDADHDAFWKGLFDDSGRYAEDDVDVYATYGANDVYSRLPIAPTMAELGRYRLVIWECGGAGYNGDSGLWEVTARRRYLAAYLRAGGTAWIGGTLTVAAMQPTELIGADFTYPKEVLPGQFPYDFLKMASDRVGNAKGGNSPGTSTDDNLVGVDPFPGRPAVYPAMDQDPAKVNPFIDSIRDGDAIFGPILASSIDGFTGALDSLYVYKAVRPNRTFNNKLNALRWHDPDPARTQGRVQWFGFPLYYMKKEQAQDTFNRSIDWFREEGS